MGIRKWVGLGLALALGACGKGGGSASGNAAATGNAAAPSASASAAAPGGSPAAAGNVHLNPGEWETTAEINFGGLGNMPPQAAQAMKALNRKVTSRQCLTPEKAQRPTGDLFSGKHQEGCTREGFTFAGGRVNGTMTCKDPRGMASTMTMDGQYGGDSFDVTMKVAASGEGRSMTWSSHSVGRRIGPCAPGADKED
ncbi:MAG: hypothetical protein QOE79_216 [Sphingomonadales bacterium]|jgi:hypothetical protein|nr:hypothetical protein [Sphingomonadales bacterium]MEA3050242.1 hypothetical protein [Sphingomonadales bacterium]